MKKKISELNQSEEVLEIRPINSVTVSRYRQAMRAGDNFPPLVIEKGTNIIVSGNQRFTAYSLEYGEDHKVNVIEREYKDKVELLEDSVRENTKHGLPLDGISRRRAVLKLASYGRSPEAIAQLIGVSVHKVEQIGGHVVYVRGSKEPKPIKSGLGNIRGRTVTEEQYESHIRKDRAMPAYQSAEQLTRWLENGWVDMEDERNIEALEKLAKAIDNALDEIRAVA